MSKDKIPTNDKGLPHGYWQRYYPNGKLMYKCTYHNGKRIIYEERFSYTGKLKVMKYHV
jgi:antitoxin component YwqK of YwqJK toxin-antitoxin module